MKMIALAAMGLALSLATVSEGRAQTILQRLERRIRQRVATPPQETDPRQSDPRQPTEADRPEQADQTQTGAPSGYVGMLVDDKQDRGRGVRVLEIRPRGPADRAGFRQQDLITRVEGARISDMADMADVLQLFGPGDQITFDVLRDGKQVALKVTLGRRPLPEEAEPVPPPPVAERPPVVPAPVVDPPAAGDGPVLAPPTEPAVREPSQIDRLQQRIDRLERRVAELEEAIKGK